MARGMSRKDKLVFQLIMLVAVATFLFGIWALVGGMAKSKPTVSGVATNGVTAVPPK